MEMDSKQNGITAQAAENSSADDTAGWLCRFIQEGWLRKRWRKRWCVLSKGKLYFFEYETRDNLEKNCGQLDLSLYQKCVQAPKKERKKSSWTFVLETNIKKDEKDPKKTSKDKSAIKAHREMLYAYTETEYERWFSKLNEAIAIARMGVGEDLEHVTKARAKPPAARRRPPTRQHIRNRATVCEISLDISTEPEKKAEATKRGHVPTTAIKPPPPSSAKAEDKTRKSDKPDNIGSDSQENATPPAVPPPPPSKAAKPALQLSTDSQSLPVTPVSSHANSPAASRGSSVNGSIADEADQELSSPISVRSTSSKKDVGTQLLRTNAKLKMLAEQPNALQKRKSQSLIMLSTVDIDEDFPPPPDLSSKTEDENFPENESDRLQRCRSTSALSSS